MKHSSTTTFVTLVGLLSLLACSDCEGSFLADTPYFFAEGETSLVVGSRSTLEVFVDHNYDPKSPLSPHSASSRHPELFTVNAVRDNQVELEALAPGSSMIDFSVIDPTDSSMTTFATPILIIEPERMNLSRCRAAETFTGEVVHARGYTALVGFDFADKDNNYAGGRGVYPIEVTPAGAGTLIENESDEREMAILIPADRVDPLTVSTTLTSSPPHDLASYELRTIDVDEITDISIGNPQSSFVIGLEEDLIVEMRAGDRFVCSRVPFTAESKTPRVCSFRHSNGMDVTTVENTRTAPRLNTKAVGVCTVVVTAIVAGVVISSTADLYVDRAVEPLPGGSGVGGGGGD